MFVYDEPVTLRLEYSLLSLSKWESKWHKPYLDENVKKTREETLDFVRCMTLTKGVDPTVYARLRREDWLAIQRYMSDPMTAATFKDRKGGKKRARYQTADLFYAAMASYWYTGYNATSIAGALVCFCVDENATVDDNGALTSNKAPEIKSNYFGKDGLYGRWKGSGFLYKISDPEEETVTVTEKIDGVVHKTFTAIQNGVYRFELSDDMLNSFEKNTAHTLTVEATDGTTTTVRSCKVTRIRSPGYVVYIGKIKGTADGQSYY